MISIYSKFKRGIAWNTVESIAYHGLYLTHHYMLFRTIDPSLYGWSSSLLGGIYFVIMIANCGLDVSMGPFFSIISSSRAACIRYGLTQLLMQAIILPVVALCGLTLLASKAGLNLPLWIIIVGIVVSEGLKRSVRTILQLAFENHATTKAEIASIGIYCLLVWSGIVVGGSCSLELLLGSLLVSSLLSLAYLLRVAWRWFVTLPEQQLTYQTTGFWMRIVQTRILGFTSVTAQQIFSSNFLTPALALSSGSLAAGVFSLIATTVSSLTSLFHKVGGYTTQALLAQIKYADLKVKQETFGFITSQLFHIMIIIVSFLALNYNTCISYSIDCPIPGSTMLVAYIYVGLMLCEYASLAYEKFFINEEQVHYIGLLQLTTIGLSMMTIWYSASVAWALVGLLSIRLLGVGALGYTSYRFWGIYPQVSINRFLLTAAVCGSTLLYVVMHYSI